MEETMKINFVIEGPPVGKARPRVEVRIKRDMGD